MGTKKTYYAWENKEFRKNMKDISSSRNCFLFSNPIDILKHFQAPGKSFNTTKTDPEKVYGCSFTVFQGTLTVYPFPSPQPTKS